MRFDFSERPDTSVNYARPLAALVVTAGLGIALAGAPTPALATEQQALIAPEATTTEAAPSGASDEKAVVADSPSAADAETTASSDAVTSAGSGTSESSDTSDTQTGEAEAVPPTTDSGESGATSEPTAPTTGEADTDKGETPDVPAAGESGDTQTEETTNPAEADNATKADSTVSAGATTDTASDASAPLAKDEASATATQSAPAQVTAAHAPGWDSAGKLYYDEGGNLANGWVVKQDLVDAAKGQGLQRYWFNNGVLYKGGLFHALLDGKDDGYSYALSAGYVLRGFYKAADGVVYYADNNGRLWSGGWQVLDAGQGLQRYYVDEDTHATEGTGYHESGWAHYTTSDGYVLRGKQDTGKGRVYLADNDGRLESGTGWVVTGKYDGNTLQRYYVEKGAARTSHFTIDGSNYYGIGGQGYVLRGYGKGVYGWLSADNDGKLAKSQWVVTDAFGQGLQRYWFGSDSLMAKNRLVTKTEGAGYWAWALSDGTILRTIWDNNAGRVFLADNDGRLAQGELADGSGWLVTGAYTNGTLQRYYIDPVTHAAKSGFYRIDGYGAVYGLGGKGYIMRGKSPWGSYVMLADNDGKLADKAGWMTTSKYDTSLQKYYLKSVEGLGGFFGAVTGFFTASDGVKAYGISGEGYVVRGKMAIAGGVVLADNDGKLVQNKSGVTAGWLVTGDYDGGTLQRYYLITTNGNYLIAKTGLFRVKDGKIVTTGGDLYYGKLDAGYVARNETINVNGYYYDANNDGKLDESFAWLSAAGRKAWDRIRGDYSKSDYYVVIDNTACRLIIFKGSANAWTPIYDWACGVGSPSVGGWSPTGKYYINANDHADWNNSYNGGPAREYYTSGVYYCTYFFLDAGIHSTVPGIPDEDQLGRPVSHGCVRIAYENAKWFYFNIPDGTAVNSYF